MIERETYSAIGTTAGTRLHMLVLVWGQDWLVAFEYRNQDGGRVWTVGWDAQASWGVSAQKRYHVLNRFWDCCLHNSRASECLVWFCVCVYF